MLKTIRNIAIAVVIMLVLMVGAGVAYIKFSGSSSTNNTNAQQLQDAFKSEAVKPRKPLSKSTEYAALESLVSPVKAGENTSITIKTLAGSQCVIGVTYGSLKETDSGLAPRYTDDFGNITWSWTVDKNAPAGKHTIKMTCKYYGRSAYLEGYLTVK